MKKHSRSLSIAIVLVLGISFFQWYACNTNNNGDYKRKQSDTTQCWVTFVSPQQWQSEGINYGAYTAELTRITKDTFTLKYEDRQKIINMMGELDTTEFIAAANKYAVWQRDTIYIVTITKPQLDSATGKPKLDSLKKPLPPIVKYGILPKQNILQDFNKSVQ